MENNELVVKPFTETALSVRDVVAQVSLIQDIMRQAMKDKEHYGTIPGCGDKKVLMKSGAEKLNLTFRMAPDPEIEVIDLGNGHREYRVKCVMRSILSGATLGAGVGSCSTMESKYRWRSKSGYEVLEGPIPADYKAKKEEYKKRGFGCKQIEGSWKWIKYTEAERVENPDIADQYNTCLKMAKKRAMVDAVLTCTAASDIFTQDVDENLEEAEEPKNTPPQQVKQSTPPQSEPSPMYVDPPANQTETQPTAPDNPPSGKLSDNSRSQIVDMLNEMFPDQKQAKVKDARLSWCENAGDLVALNEVTKIYQTFLTSKKG